MSSSLSTSSTNPSNPVSVAQVLSNRGFDWRRANLHDIQSQSSDISFETEWEKFVSAVKSITNVVYNKQHSEESKDQKEKKFNETKKAPIHPSDAETPKESPEHVGHKGIAGDLIEEQKSEEQTNRQSEEPLKADVAWTNHFMNVITNAGLLYKKEKAFDNALFDALRNSLGAFVDPIASIASGGSNLIVLQTDGSVQVGFGKGVNREKLGFKDKYALARSSQPDHGCFVFGNKVSKRDSSGTVVTHESFYDLTAVVELKLEKTSCKPFVFDEGRIKQPDFEKDQAPMGQAMLYSMDMWHCLARRGIGAKSVPVVVLAGKSEPYDTNQVCCLDAHIEIPEYCGDRFVYTIARLVTFDETQEPSSNELKSKAPTPISWNSRDARAIAIYIKTMRIGLENAALIMEKYNDRLSIFHPVSLFCHNLLKGENKAKLIASPIPLESHLRESGIRIHQGELFLLKNPKNESFSGLKNVFWFVDSELPNECVLKVSCTTVHNLFISHAECKEALKVLYDTCSRDSVFRKELSKVLLGYCHINWSASLVTIMKNLLAEGESFKVLEHKAFKDEKLLKLWSAFCDLVKSLLTPMADVNVVHLDIRSDADFTHNILVREMKQRNSYTIELRLIDFDSVVVCGFPASPHDNAVFWNDLRDTVVTRSSWESAYRYLFWQVLWIAYTWYLSSSLMQLDIRPAEKNTSNFLTFLFVDEYFVNFKSWLGVKGV